jgi:hypothetical protein
MYPLAYFLLALGSIFYFEARINQEEDKVYDSISKYVLPFNYLLIWSIELIFCFEIQLIRVKWTANGPAEC